jgi:prepilin-type processing-associated H-X9-DG protein
MREDLIGYLLGALDPDEMERVTEALRNDPALRDELEQLRRMLEPLDQANEIFEPPGDLIDRTMASIPPGVCSDPDLDGVQSGMPNVPAANLPVESSAESGDQSSDGGGWDSDAASRPKDSGQRTEATVVLSGVAPIDQHWRFFDFVGLAMAAMVLAGLVLPEILRQRAAARAVVCQSQLRQAGTALVEYLIRASDRRFPKLQTVGPEAFAGMYAVQLNDAGLIPGGRPMWCPSLDRPAPEFLRAIPSRQEIHRAAPAQLARLQRIAGGHYAYTLGIFEQGQYRAPRFEGRPGFAILADAPLRTVDRWRTPHDNRGFNILFEDGHVQFVADFETSQILDHPFLNRSGEVEAGLDPNDASLAPSATPPFMPIRRGR